MARFTLPKNVQPLYYFRWNCCRFTRLPASVRLCKPLAAWGGFSLLVGHPQLTSFTMVRVYHEGRKKSTPYLDVTRLNFSFVKNGRFSQNLPKITFSFYLQLYWNFPFFSYPLKTFFNCAGTSPLNNFFACAIVAI